MKHTAEMSRKFKKLKRRLGRPMYVVKGVLESIWHVGIGEAQDGAIGRFSNEDIAALIEWEDDADKLIDDLVESGWLDRVNSKERLIIHNWELHCPKFLRANMKRHGKTFAQSRLRGASCSEETAQGSIQPNLTKPNQTKIAEDKPLHQKTREENIDSSNSPLVIGCDDLAQFVKEFFARYPQHRHGKRDFVTKKLSKLNPDKSTQANILYDLELRSCTTGWMDSGGRYIPGASKYIDQELWNTPIKEVELHVMLPPTIDQMVQIGAAIDAHEAHRILRASGAFIR